MATGSSINEVIGHDKESGLAEKINSSSRASQTQLATSKQAT